MKRDQAETGRHACLHLRHVPYGIWFFRTLNSASQLCALSSFINLAQSSGLNIELFFDKFSQGFFNFRVTGHRRLFAIERVRIYVMSASMTFEITTSLRQLLNQCTSFQTSTPSSKKCDSGCSISTFEVSSII